MISGKHRVTKRASVRSAIGGRGGTGVLGRPDGDAVGHTVLAMGSAGAEKRADLSIARAAPRQPLWLRTRQSIGGTMRASAGQCR